MPTTRPDHGPQPVLPSARAWPLFNTAASRTIEQAALAAHPPHTLMARAGLAVARLALAVAPGAQRLWVACGPGNNGGDGLVAASHLHAAGWQVRVSLLGDPTRLPGDAQWALAQAHQAGVAIEAGLPSNSGGWRPDLAIDALLGLGQRRPPEGALADAVRQLNAQGAPVLAVDLPTGLCGDTGRRLGDAVVQARHTLALLTLKPGLFTHQGRDQVGRVWLDDLGTGLGTAGGNTADGPPASAWLSGPPCPTARSHTQHKGSFGDVLVLGGAPGMAGAAVLAASAALAAGAGRVYLARLDGAMEHVPQRPELMTRPLDQALSIALLQQTTVVCGCGGGQAVREVLPQVLHHAAQLVLDADALNAVAADPGLRTALRARATRGRPTVLTPHPLEAARLLGCSTVDVQADRLAQAQALADGLQAVVVLKGSGSVVAAPGQAPAINPTGSARLGTGGTGDVLAGWLGGLWAQAGPLQGREAACASVWWHGAAADTGPQDQPLRAADLIEAMAANPRPAG
jgi:hydroxyethylthiazole kinase-like uncharacterized protein yjeF